MIGSHSFYTALGFITLLLNVGNLLNAAPPSRPNIIVLLADDLRWDAFGWSSNSIVQTPHLNRLAATGVRGRNSFVTTSICNVSRASIFSGQAAKRHGIVDFATPFTSIQWAQTYPALLHRHGYRTGFIGKFGVGSNEAVAAMSSEFDYWRGLPGQADLFFDSNDKSQTHKTARFGDQALEFLRGADGRQPFCLSVSFNAPHARDGQPREFRPDPRDEELYSDVTIPRATKDTDEWFQRLPVDVQNSEGRKRWQRRFASSEMYQTIVRDYYRLISGIDREVGRIMQALDELRLADNTVIVFTSDNGFFLGERGLADKWFFYEESIRVPLIVFDPRLPQGRRGTVMDAMTLNIDLAPTILDWAGVRMPRVMEGRSVVPLLEGKHPRGWRTEFFYEHHTLPKIIPPSEGIRTERWKYLRWLTASPAEELYDLRADPGEAHDLAKDPKYARRLTEFRRRWQKQTANDH